MRQVIIGQFAVFQHRFDVRQTGLWTMALAMATARLICTTGEG
jgi:hypothetical protein